MSAGLYNANRTFVFNSIVADNDGAQCGGPASIAAAVNNLTNSTLECTGFSVQGAGSGVEAIWINGDQWGLAPHDWLSPARDGGSDCEITDQRGLLRSPNGGTCDLGAFEKWIERSCQQPNRALPDDTLFAESDDMIISQVGTVIDVMAYLNVTHPHVGDLDGSLRNNGVGIIQLFDRPGHPATTNGCSGDNISASFIDGALMTVEDSCDALSPTISGFVQPDQALENFYGSALNDTWTMFVRDTIAGDTGTWNEWCLDVDYEPDVSAETLTQFTVSASQPRIGPNDSFYFRVDITTGSNGWDGLDPDLLTFEADVTDMDGGNVTAGTPIVPDGSNIDCAKPGGIGTFFRCDGDDATASLAANTSYTFYFPYTNTDNGNTDGCDSGWVSGWLRDTNLVSLDILAWPDCVTVSQGSTYPPGQAAPTAIGLGTVGSSAEFPAPILLLFTITLASIIAYIKRRQSI